MSRNKPRTDKLAENIFEHLCVAARLTVNRVGDDQNGWDFIVEYPSAEGRFSSPDTKPPGLTCLVQIKSTGGGGKSYRIKLSNALKFAKNSLPCFTLIVVFAKDGVTPKHFRLQHFGETQIADALRAARTAHSKGADEMNRELISFAVSTSDDVERDAIVARIATLASKPDYTATKLKFAADVGYEGGGGKGKFSVKLDDMGQFVDALLGLSKEVPITHFEFREARFGIPGRDAVVVTEPGRIKITPEPFKHCAVIVSSPDNVEEIHMAGDVFTPGIPSLPVKYRKIRIRTDLLELTVQVGESGEISFGDVKASFDPQSRVTLEKIDHLAALWSWFAAGDAGLEIRVEGKKLLNGKIGDTDAKVEPYWRALRRLTKALSGFVHASLWPPGAEFTLQDFRDLDPIVEFVGTISGDSGTATLKVDQSQLLGSQTQFLMHAGLELGNVFFFAIVQYRIEKFDLEPGAVKLHLENPSPRHRAVLSGNAASNRAYIRDEMLAADRAANRDAPDEVISWVPDASS
jgi:hypothetical protein